MNKEGADVNSILIKHNGMRVSYIRVAVVTIQQTDQILQCQTQSLKIEFISMFVCLRRLKAVEIKL